jgi:hypothetical protein
MTYKRALEADARLAAKNALKIRAALRQTFDPKRVYEQYLLTQPNQSDSAAQNNARARAWVMLNVRVNMEALKEVMLRVWAEGYVTGEAFADEQLRIARELNKADDTMAEVDWANWQPGDRAAALLLRPPKAFQQLLSSQGITFKEFSDTTVRDIGNAIGEAIELGLPAERAAKRIMTHVANPARALSIAITEQNRAISYATVNRYKEAGLEQMEWEVSSPCDKCAQNANQVVQIGQPFRSGATQPPQHPHCRCVLLPVLPDFAEQQQAPGAVIVTPPAPAVPMKTDKDIIDEALIAARAAKDNVFKPGQWRTLTSAEIQEDVITEYLSRYNMMQREQVIDWINRGKFGKETNALIDKGIVYQNGAVKVSFYSGGRTVPAKVQKEILDHVDMLQETNPKSTTIRITIGKSKRNAYGWATLNGEDIWLSPKTAKTVVPNKIEGGKFKMPALSDNPQWKYTLTHEWGHHIDNGSSFYGQADETVMAISRLKKEFPDAFKSIYSGENTKEFYAEMFAEYILTNGTSNNLLVQGMAKEFGWKVPKGAVAVKPVPVIGYVPAKKDFDYYNRDITESFYTVNGKVNYNAYNIDGQNQYLKNLMETQGFTGKPRVVGADEFQTYISQGSTPIYRGITGEKSEEYARQLLNGEDPFVGKGMFGDGTYFANKKQVAVDFSTGESTPGVPRPKSSGTVVEGVLDPRAKVITKEDLGAEMHKWYDEHPEYIDLAQDFYQDYSSFATARGYDAVIVRNPKVTLDPNEVVDADYYVILNRTALIMKEMP